MNDGINYLIHNTLAHVDGYVLMDDAARMCENENPLIDLENKLLYVGLKTSLLFVILLLVNFVKFP